MPKLFVALVSRFHFSKEVFRRLIHLEIGSKFIFCRFSIAPIFIVGVFCAPLLVYCVVWRKTEKGKSWALLIHIRQCKARRNWEKIKYSSRASAWIPGEEEKRRGYKFQFCLFSQLLWSSPGAMVMKNIMFFFISLRHFPALAFYLGAFLIISGICWIKVRIYLNALVFILVYKQSNFRYLLLDTNAGGIFSPHTGIRDPLLSSNLRLASHKASLIWLYVFNKFSFFLHHITEPFEDLKINDETLFPLLVGRVKARVLKARKLSVRKLCNIFFGKWAK